MKTQHTKVIVPEGRAKPAKQEKREVITSDKTNFPGSYKEALTGKAIQNTIKPNWDGSNDILIQILAEIKSLNEINKKLENWPTRLENHMRQAAK